MLKKIANPTQIVKRVGVVVVLSIICVGSGLGASQAKVVGFTDGMDYINNPPFPTDISFKDGNNKLPDVDIPASADASKGCHHTFPCFNQIPGGKATILDIEVPAADASWTSWTFSFKDDTGVVYGTYLDKPHGYVANVAPETSTWAMMVAGFAGLALLAYRRSSRDKFATAA
jgi:hypothetical protein